MIFEDISERNWFNSPHLVCHNINKNNSCLDQTNQFSTIFESLNNTWQWKNNGELEWLINTNRTFTYFRAFTQTVLRWRIKDNNYVGYNYMPWYNKGFQNQHDYDSYQLLVHVKCPMKNISQSSQYVGTGLINKC